MVGLGSETMNADTLILQRFRGLYDTGLSISRGHLQGLARGFEFIQVPPPADDLIRHDLIRFAKEECVIKDEQSFHRFIARIPEKVMAFVPSPPPSKDRLLQCPKIDFDNHMVLVIISHELNCFIDLDIVAIELTSKAMKVLCRYSEPGPIVSKAIDYGAYCAVVIRRFDGEVVFVPSSE